MYEKHMQNIKCNITYAYNAFDYEWIDYGQYQSRPLELASGATALGPVLTGPAEAPRMALLWLQRQAPRSGGCTGPCSQVRPPLGSTFSSKHS